jgi:hypothetical protein
MTDWLVADVVHGASDAVVRLVGAIDLARP